MANILASSFLEIESGLFFKGLNGNMRFLHIWGKRKRVVIDFKTETQARRNRFDGVALVAFGSDGPYRQG